MVDRDRENEAIERSLQRAEAYAVAAGLPFRPWSDSDATGAVEAHDRRQARIEEASTVLRTILRENPGPWRPAALKQAAFDRSGSGLSRDAIHAALLYMEGDGEIVPSLGFTISGVQE